jgi:hypothetical protein
MTQESTGISSKTNDASRGRSRFKRYLLVPWWSSRLVLPRNVNVDGHIGARRIPVAQLTVVIVSDAVD